MEARSSATTVTVLHSDGLACQACVARVEKALQATAGVERASVRLDEGRIEVHHDPNQASTDDLVEAIRLAGYEARPSGT